MALIQLSCLSVFCSVALAMPRPYPEITYEELRPRVERGNLLLVDVRNRSELLDPGRIPKSFNLPLPEVVNAMELTSDEFLSNYGFELPPSDEEIILSCRSGRRVIVAADIMTKRGFNNLRLYYGSFKEWNRNGAPISREISGQELIENLSLNQTGPVLDISAETARAKRGSTTIPGSINVPKSELRSELLLPSDVFIKKYGLKKPAPGDVITVVGGGPDGTQEALPVLNDIGYCKLRLYLGSVDDVLAPVA